MSAQWVEKKTVEYTHEKYREMVLDFGVVDAKGRKIGAVAVIVERSEKWIASKAPSCPLAVRVQATRNGEKYGASQSWVCVENNDQAISVVFKKVEGARTRAIAKEKKNVGESR